MKLFVFVKKISQDFNSPQVRQFVDWFELISYRSWHPCTPRSALVLNILLLEQSIHHKPRENIHFLFPSTIDLHRHRHVFCLCIIVLGEFRQ